MNRAQGALIRESRNVADRLWGILQGHSERCTSRECPACELLRRTWCEAQCYHHVLRDMLGQPAEPHWVRWCGFYGDDGKAVAR